jgi:hypothetical protein
VECETAKMLLSWKEYMPLEKPIAVSGALAAAAVTASLVITKALFAAATMFVDSIRSVCTTDVVAVWELLVRYLPPERRNLARK